MVKKTLLVSMLTLTSSVASAGGIQENASITSIGSGSFYHGQCGFNCVVVGVNPPPTGANNCGYSSGWHFAINLDSIEGASQVSTVLAAQAAGKEIGIAGNGDCTANGGIEKVYYMFTK